MEWHAEVVKGRKPLGTFCGGFFFFFSLHLLVAAARRTLASQLAPLFIYLFAVLICSPQQVE